MQHVHGPWVCCLAPFVLVPSPLSLWNASVLFHILAASWTLWSGAWRPPALPPAAWTARRPPSGAARCCAPLPPVRRHVVLRGCQRPALSTVGCYRRCCRLSAPGTTEGPASIRVTCRCLPPARRRSGRPQRAAGVAQSGRGGAQPGGRLAGVPAGPLVVSGCGCVVMVRGPCVGWWGPWVRGGL